MSRSGCSRTEFSLYLSFFYMSFEIIRWCVRISSATFFARCQVRIVSLEHIPIRMKKLRLYLYEDIYNGVKLVPSVKPIQWTEFPKAETTADIPKGKIPPFRPFPDQLVSRRWNPEFDVGLFHFFLSFCDRRGSKKQVCFCGNKKTHLRLLPNSINSVLSAIRFTSLKR